MDGLFNAVDLRNLSNLLNQSEREGDLSDSDREGEDWGDQKTRDRTRHQPENPRFNVNIRKVNPEDDADAAEEQNSSSDCNNSKQESHEKKKANRWTIWEEHEVPQGPLPEDVSSDPRTCPEYDISYQQAVSSEDIFLGIGNKNPSTASCEDMIVAVQLPGEVKERIECDLTVNTLDVRSVKYRLALSLPHPVLTQSCKATWDPVDSVLKLTLRLTREWDFLNF